MSEDSKSIQIRGEYRVEQWEEAKKHVMEAKDDYNMTNQEVLVFLLEWFNEGKVYALMENE